MKKKITSIALSATIISQPLSGIVYSQDNETNTNEYIIQSQEDSQEVNIPDENLRRAINDNLGKSADSSITIEELESIESLDASGYSIKDLYGIEYCSNLRWLNLSDNQISDISDISNLTNLHYLYLDLNQISEISAIGNLTNLMCLNLIDNQISNIRAISNLTNLRYLYLDLNQISDISAIGNLTNLDSASITTQSVDLGTVDINNYQVTMNIPNVYDINGNLIKTPVAYYGGDNYEVFEDKIVWSNVYEPGTFGMSFASNNENYDYNITFTQKAIKTQNSNEKPVITASDITLKVGDEFDPLSGVSASDKEDGEITNIEVKGDEVDTSKVGEYKVIYEVTDSDGNTVSKEIKVTVRSNEKPVISASDVTLEVGEIFEPLKGVSARDEEDGEITNIEVKGDEVDTSKVGEYKVIYEVTDSDGNTVSKEIKVDVVNDKNQIVNIPDENLKRELNWYIGQSEDSDITVEQLKSITYLYISDKSVKNLEGLQYCTNLTNLDLSHNEISDISILGDITDLTDLDLSHNEISEIRGLENLTNLTDLYLNGNEISEIRGLENLTNLNILALIDNEISEIRGLDNLTNLNILDLSENQISEIRGLDNLTNLTGLYLGGNQISEIRGLDNLTNLTDLDLRDNEIREIRGLDNLTNLKYLYDNEIREIRGLDNLTNLNNLDLSGNQISEIKGLDSLINLNNLDLSGNQISEIKGLDNLTNLQYLYLNENEITDFRPLSKLNIKNYDWLYNQTVYLETTEIKNSQVTMYIPPIYDIDGSLIEKTLSWCDGGDNYEVFDDRIVWNNIDKETTFKVSFNIKNSDNVTFIQKAIKSQNSNEKPVITASDVTLKVGDEFDPLSGVSASDKEDGEITKIEVKGDKVDTSKVGEYKVIYEVTDSDGNTESKEIKVTVRSNEKPVITASDVTLKVGDEFDPLSGVSASDKEDGEITKIEVKGDKVDTSKVGEYKVVYEVTDKDGNTESKEIKVTVLNVFSTFTVDSIKSKSPKITGKGVEGAIVNAYVNGNQIGDNVTVKSNGKYNIKIPKQKIGTEIVVKISKTGYVLSEKSVIVED